MYQSTEQPEGAYQIDITSGTQSMMKNGLRQEDDMISLNSGNNDLQQLEDEIRSQIGMGDDLIGDEIDLNDQDTDFESTSDPMLNNFDINENQNVHFYITKEYGGPKKRGRKRKSDKDENSTATGAAPKTAPSNSGPKGVSGARKVGPNLYAPKDLNFMTDFVLEKLKEILAMNRLSDYRRVNEILNEELCGPVLKFYLVIDQPPELEEDGSQTLILRCGRHLSKEATKLQLGSLKFLNNQGGHAKEDKEKTDLMEELGLGKEATESDDDDDFLFESSKLQEDTGSCHLALHLRTSEGQWKIDEGKHPSSDELYHSPPIVKTKAYYRKLREKQRSIGYQIGDIALQQGFNKMWDNAKVDFEDEFASKRMTSLEMERLKEEGKAQITAINTTGFVQLQQNEMNIDSIEQAFMEDEGEQADSFSRQPPSGALGTMINSGIGLSSSNDFSPANEPAVDSEPVHASAQLRSINLKAKKKKAMIENRTLSIEQEVDDLENRQEENLQPPADEPQVAQNEEPSKTTDEKKAITLKKVEDTMSVIDSSAFQADFVEVKREDTPQKVLGVNKKNLKKAKFPARPQVMPGSSSLPHPENSSDETQDDYNPVDFIEKEDSGSKAPTRSGDTEGDDEWFVSENQRRMYRGPDYMTEQIDFFKLVKTLKFTLAKKDLVKYSTYETHPLASSQQPPKRARRAATKDPIIEEDDEAPQEGDPAYKDQKEPQNENFFVEEVKEEKRVIPEDCKTLIRSFVVSTHTWKESYRAYKDIVLVCPLTGRAAKENRFNMRPILLYGINSEGRNTIFGIGFINFHQSEAQENLEFIFSEFLAYMAEPPAKIIVSRKNAAAMDNDSIYQALLKVYGKRCGARWSPILGPTQILYCPFDLYEEIKERFEFLSKIKEERFLYNILLSLPFELNKDELDQNLRELIRLDWKQVDNLRDFLSRLNQTKHLWSRCQLLSRDRTFTGDTSLHQRNEMVEAHVANFMVRGTKDLSSKEFLKSLSAIESMEYVYQHEYKALPSSAIIKPQVQSLLASHFQPLLTKHAAKRVRIQAFKSQNCRLVGSGDDFGDAEDAGEDAEMAHDEAGGNMMKSWTLKEEGLEKKFVVKLKRIDEAIGSQGSILNDDPGKEEAQDYLQCSCGLNQIMGLPCLHEIYLVWSGAAEASSLFVTERWKQDYDSKTRLKIKEKMDLEEKERLKKQYREARHHAELDPSKRRGGTRNGRARFLRRADKKAMDPEQIKDLLEHAEDGNEDEVRSGIIEEINKSLMNIPIDDETPVSRKTSSNKGSDYSNSQVTPSKNRNGRRRGITPRKLCKKRVIKARAKDEARKSGKRSNRKDTEKAPTPQPEETEEEKQARLEREKEIEESIVSKLKAVALRYRQESLELKAIKANGTKTESQEKAKAASKVKKAVKEKSPPKKVGGRRPRRKLGDSQNNENEEDDETYEKPAGVKKKSIRSSPTRRSSRKVTTKKVDASNNKANSAEPEKISPLTDSREYKSVLDLIDQQMKEMSKINAAGGEEEEDVIMDEEEVDFTSKASELKSTTPKKSKKDESSNKEDTNKTSRAKGARGSRAAGGTARAAKAAKEAKTAKLTKKKAGLRSKSKHKSNPSESSSYAPSSNSDSPAVIPSDILSLSQQEAQSSTNKPAAGRSASSSANRPKSKSSQKPRATAAKAKSRSKAADEAADVNNTDDALDAEDVKAEKEEHEASQEDQQDCQAPGETTPGKANKPETNPSIHSEDIEMTLDPSDCSSAGQGPEMAGIEKEAEGVAVAI